MIETLAIRLRQCRKERGLSQIQVATYCDITEHAYQNYELKKQQPRLDILCRIAEFYGVSLDYLVGRTDNRNVNQ